MSGAVVHKTLTASGAVRQAKFAAVVASTRTAQDVKGNTGKLLKRKLQNPSRWTLNSVGMEPATKRRPAARVFFKDFGGKGIAAGKYLVHMETGGSRATKRFERALQARGLLMQGEFVIPADGGSLDLAGMNGRRVGGIYQKILSGLDAASDPMQNQTAKSLKRKSRRGRRPTRYWVQRDDGEGRAVAIWERVSAKVSRPVLIVVRRMRYGATLDFAGSAAKTARVRWPMHFAKAWEMALRTAK